MLWSHATGPDGVVTGLEYSPEIAKIAQDAIAKEGINNVEIIVGNAAETYVSPTSLPFFAFRDIFLASTEISFLTHDVNL